MTFLRDIALLALPATLSGMLAAAVVPAGRSGGDERAALSRLVKDGNFKDAYVGYRRLALDPTSDPHRVGGDLTQGVECLRRLNRVAEIDAFREAVIEVHQDSWRTLWAAAESYVRVDHYGVLVAGQFERGRRRGGGQVVSGLERDRVRALQLFQQAMPLVADAPDRDQVGRFYLALARALLLDRGYREAWRFQSLTDLDRLPDYLPGQYLRGGRPRGAPVGGDGTPIFYTAPRRWSDASNDGQRWRWALRQAAEVAPRYLNRTRLELADFLHHQFGVQTLADYGPLFGRFPSPNPHGDQSGTYALHTLSATESIARLAIGVRRFSLPDEMNFIGIYRQIVDDDRTGYGQQALTKIAQIFENRRHYPLAAAAWQESIEKYGDQKDKRRRLDQIVNAWGQFESVMAQPAETGATVEYRFRNGRKVVLTAHRIRVDQLLADVRAYLKAQPKKLDWNQLNLGNIGHRLVSQRQSRYRGKLVAQWALDLTPPANHFDKRITITTPLRKAGAYLVTAKMADGNTSSIVLWVSDTAIVKKPMAGKALYYVADAVGGKPIPQARVAWFGYWQEHLGRNRFRIHTRESAGETDASGLVVQPVDAKDRRFRWIATATTAEGRLAFLGFTGAWSARYDNPVYNRVKVFTITDRPVYRPRQSVQFKFWVRHAGYDRDDTSRFANQTFQVEIRDPKGEKVVDKAMTSDQYGGIAGDYELPADATLGVYRLQVVGRGGGHFRVEEYKKPEFEVTVDAPSKPVLLGEKITATVKARYYFGAPVTDAKVRVRVQRTSYLESWFPTGRWDWLYGRGYWWFPDDYTWYPGWKEWGCRRPNPWWWWHSPAPPELVVEQETAIRPDGTVAVEIDTVLASESHPDEDHRYQITAEVIDPSRRTIVGSGEVLVARKPFRVCAWVGRGYYRVGEVIDAHFAARTLDGRPVEGQGKVTLLRVQYDRDRQPVETPVRTWDLDTNGHGAAQLRIKASTEGQYRLDYQLTDAGGRTQRGGYLLTIIGAGFDGAEFRFNDLEVIAERREYAPGESVKLQVNTNRIGATVLLFIRPSGGVYLPPQIVRMTGKSRVVEVGVVQGDMPNFFVEAVTVARGQVFRVTREVHVPPSRRILGVEVVASSPAYAPGQKARLTMRLTDAAGKPFVGAAVLAVYDKAVEYISGGSNVPNIQEFFWKWRRQHRPRRESNLDRRQFNLAEPNRPTMENVGLFGGTVADQLAPTAQERGVHIVTRQMARNDVGAVMDAAEGEGMAVPAPAEAAGGGGGGGGEVAGRAAKAGGGPAGPIVEPTVRTRFADTALWKASLTTNDAGLAEVEFDLPDSLTTWRVKAWAMGTGTRVGQGETEVTTRKEILVRMQAPRFFLETDRVVLSANVHNYLDHDKQVDVVLELDGATLKPTDAPRRTVHIPANGQVRVDWHVTVVREGQATVRMKALTDEASDAMEMRFPVAVHGMLKMDSFSGALRPRDPRGSFQIEVPERRRVAQSHLEVRFSPTLAGAMVDCLPYLVDYPYGCTEQTLNRFLPTVITQRVLLDMQLDLATIRQKRTNLNVQEIGDDRQRARQWQRDDRNPVFDVAEVRRMATEGIKALVQMQLTDGGWGWFSGWGEHSHPHTTALVVHGLQLAQRNDVAVPSETLKKGIAWLASYRDRQVVRLNNFQSKTKPYKQHADNIDALVDMVLVDAGVGHQSMTDTLYRDRNHLSVYGKALLGLALHRQDARGQLAMILRNIGQYVVEDDTNQTAYLNLPGSDWWYWYGSPYEAHAYYLKLLAATQPKSRTSARLVKYLLNNRKHATYWNSTRDTAMVVEAMADYLQASGEDKPDMVVQVWMDGKLRKEVSITPHNLFTFGNKFVLDGEAVETGVHTVELRRTGVGPLYYNAYLSNFTQEPHIRRAGLELQVDRKYFKLVPEEATTVVAGGRGQVVDQAAQKYRRMELPNLASVDSGDLVEIELTVASKNDYEYIIVEDMKAAGFEPATLRSGYAGNALGAYVELRDNRVVLFVRRLPRGRHSVSYRMRAEIPGQFSALPTRVYAMYAPELKGNSDEIKLTIGDDTSGNAP